jgi:hypothetical protein
LGVAVIGSLLSTRNQDTMMSTLAPYHVRTRSCRPFSGRWAERSGWPPTSAASSARNSGSGTDLGLATGACVAAAGCLIALIALPSKHRSADVPAAEDALGDGHRADDGEQPQEHR